MRRTLCISQPRVASFLAMALQSGLDLPIINPGDREYDVIYVNGDNNLENIRRDDEQWKVVMTETEFKARMFEEE